MSDHAISRARPVAGGRPSGDRWRDGDEAAIGGGMATKLLGSGCVGKVNVAQCGPPDISGFQQGKGAVSSLFV